MDIKKLILNTITEKSTIKTSDIVKLTGFSRAYVNRFLQELRDSGKIILLGKANNARYIRADAESISVERKNVVSVHKIIVNKGLSEDSVLQEIKKSTSIFSKTPENVSAILDYAFLEILNNAIEHSRSKKIEVTMQKDEEGISFNINDKGIGIFNNIMQKKKLNNEMEAIQDLLKGKQTTDPKAHTGEGIFFTSKIADMCTIKSSLKKIIFNNIIDDIFIKDIKKTSGTKVFFHVNSSSSKKIENIFKAYTDSSFEFNKTEITVKLYKMGTEHISRSQARRILSGLDKFRTVILDFKNVKTVGQGFADEVFRVWKRHYPNIDIVTKNANENITFMIKRALANKE